MQIVSVFENYIDFIFLMKGISKKPRIVLKTRDGLKIISRNNYWDARIIVETFLRKIYLREIHLANPTPIVIDIGGYIGDFSLYATKYLNAKVIVYEPVPDNYRLLIENIKLNGYETRIQPQNEAVGVDGEITINLKKTGQDIHASRYMYSDSEDKISVRSLSLDTLFKSHNLSTVDILKIDCEGCEYEILANASLDLLKKVKNLTFEYHGIPDFKVKLESVLRKLKEVGFSVENNHQEMIVTASRINSISTGEED
jgi:FkbM family methyltransferase